MPTYFTPFVRSGRSATTVLAGGDRRAGYGRSLLGALSAAALCVCLASPLPAQQATAAASAIQQDNAHIAQTVDGGSAASPQTRALLTARHAVLEQVLQNAPATARSYALDAKTRDALLKADPSYADLVEQDVPLTGELAVTVQDNLKAHTSQTVYSLHTYTGFYALSFANQPKNLDRMAHHQVTVTGISLPHVIAAETIRGATLAEAEACSVAAPAARMAALSSAKSQAVPPSTGSGVNSTAPTACSDLGPQNTAVIILNMPSTPNDGTTPASSTPLLIQAPYNTQAYYNDLMNPGKTPNVSSYTSETSYGQTTYATDVYGPFMLPQAYSCNPGSALFAAGEAAVVANGIDVSKYNRFIYVVPVNACAYDGLGTLPCIMADSMIPHEHSNMIYTIPQTYNASTAGPTDSGGINYDFLVLAHEGGHNLGMNHSNTLDFGTGLTLGPIDFGTSNPGTVTGHPSTDAEAQATNPAGSTSISAVNLEYGDPFPIMAGIGFLPYNAEHRYDILGWIPASGEQDVTAAGSFSIAPTEASSGLRSLHVLRDATSNSWMWLEYHQPQGVYTNYALPLEPANNTYTAGTELLYATGSLDAGHTFLLDTTPTSATNNFADAFLADGVSWSDPYSLLTITSGSQTSSAMPVTVSYDTACAAPVLSASTLSPAAGTGSVTVTATAGCAWNVSSNASWISFGGAKSGTGNGSVPFAYTANTTAVQRSSYITTARQSLPILQEGTAVNVVSLSPSGKTVAPGTFTPLTFNVVNAGGAGSDSTFYFNINGISPLLAVKSCTVGAQSQGDGTIGIYDATLGGTTYVVGASGTATIGACTFNLGNSTFTANGSSASLTLSTSFPAAFYGNHSIQVSGDVNNITNTVGYVNVNTPTAFTSATMLGANPASITAAQSTTLTATVNGSPGVPTGSVSFATASTNLGACTLASGTCSVSVSGSALQAGANSILATYAGGGGYPSSVSNAVTVTVTGVAPTATATPTFSPAAGTYAAAQTVTISDATAGAAIYYTIDGSTATTSSTPYSAPITVGVSETLHAVAIASGASLSANAVATYTISSGGGSQTTINFGSGFTTNGLSLQGASVSGNILQLTDGGKNEAHSVFFNQPMNIKSFTTDFDFQLTSANADGFTFVLQNSAKGPSAVGGLGYNLGYGGMGSSVAVKFDLHNNSGEGSNSTGFYKNGASPQMPSQDLTSSGVNLHSGHKLLAHLTYDGTTLALTLTDTVTNAVFTTSTAIDIPGTIGSNTAYIGFTGGTGGSSAVQNILDWTFSNSKAPMVLDYGSGFTARGLKLQGATISGTSLQITDGGKNEARSAFYNTPVSVQSFSTNFNFQLTSATADGFTFTIQNSSKGPSAVGGLGYNLGYGGIGSSVAVKFDLHSNNGEGSNSTGFYKNGATPTTPSVDMTSSGVNLHSGDKLLAHLTYDGATLTLTLTDTVTNKVFTTSTAIDIPGTVGSTSAYVGFTGGTGGSSATQNILNWTYSTP